MLPNIKSILLSQTTCHISYCFRDSSRQPQELYSAHGTDLFPSAKCGIRPLERRLHSNLKRPTAFVVHLSSKSHNMVLDNFRKTMITCQAEIKMGLYTDNNMFLFFVNEGCKNNLKVTKSLFSREEVRRHPLLAVFRAPCSSAPLFKINGTVVNRVLLMERYNYYQGKRTTFLAEKSPTKALFYPLSAKVST